jgi:2-polyprenyl-6-methoxyphenol hydroxylase-like FAD-dependent oxidoreductase
MRGVALPDGQAITAARGPNCEARGGAFELAAQPENMRVETVFARGDVLTGPNGGEQFGLRDDAAGTREQCVGHRRLDRGQFDLTAVDLHEAHVDVELDAVGHEQIPPGGDGGNETDISTSHVVYRSTTHPGPQPGAAKGACMAEAIVTRCCVAGGGPAGMMLGFLLARAGIDVVVLEKHADFFRDFRGDTIHPSTMQLMHELGLLDDFLTRPHNEMRTIKAQIGDALLTVADLTHLPTVTKFMALMPQWDFLNFLAEHGKKYKAFHLMMESTVTGLIVEDGIVRGTRVTTASGDIEIRADLVVGADGRSSTVRGAANLAVRDIGAPIDVLWMRVPRETTDPEQVLAHADFGEMLIMLDRGDYWQCAFVIAKGGFGAIQSAGIAAFRTKLTTVVPWLGTRAETITTFDDVKLLTVTVDRLLTWYSPGLLCIGDAAHAMSPIGGVGINLAVQDAVAAANRLYPAFRRGVPSLDDLRAIQQRRTFPMAVIQRAQVFIQDMVLVRLLKSPGKIKPPPAMRLITSIPLFRRLFAYVIGVGVRPEHIGTPERQ